MLGMVNNFIAHGHSASIAELHFFMTAAETQTSVTVERHKKLHPESM
jgi:hypothetical protein